MSEELDLRQSRPDGVRGEANTKVEISNQVFIVHGHDEEMKQAVARTLEKLGLEPVILHEQPDQGRTIIEKFTDYADVRFAVVLLSPDDMGHKRSEPSSAARPRRDRMPFLKWASLLGVWEGVTS